MLGVTSGVSVLLLVLVAGPIVPAQNTSVPASTFSADYPTDRPGVFIQSSSWMELQGAMPFKTRAAHGIAASFSYGLVPAKVVADYQGDHASAAVNPGQPVICICHIFSLPGQPVIVRLHPKKNSRELDGGKMIVYPVVGGSKMAGAKESDLIPVDVSQPNPQVWLVRPHSPLEPGEYALMLGTQNLNLFPFTVAEAPADPAPVK
jgi:hypothetical protein